MMAADAAASHFKSVSVSSIDHAAGFIIHITVFKCHAVLNGHCSDFSCGDLGKEIPAVIRIIGSNAASEHISFSAGQLGCKAICILHGFIAVIIGGTV